MSAQPCGCDLEAKEPHFCEQHDLSMKPPVTQEAEVRITDPLTGGQKGSKLARFDLIPSEPLWALARHYGVGAQKYEDRNYEKGYKWGLSVAALQRHLHLWLMGEDVDEETGSHHLIAVAWHAFALFLFQLRGVGTDDVRRVGETQ